MNEIKCGACGIPDNLHTGTGLCRDAIQGVLDAERARAERAEARLAQVEAECDERRQHTNDADARADAAEDALELRGARADFMEGVLSQSAELNRDYIARWMQAEAECDALRDLLREAHRELSTIEAITVSPSDTDGLLDLVRRIDDALKAGEWAAAEVEGEA